MMSGAKDGINVEARPSGTGCAECEAAGGWWFHLRRLCGVWAYWLLRQLAEPACGEAQPCDGAPGDPEL